MPPEGNETADDRALLAEALWNDPETRPDLEKIIKKKFPHAPIPTFEARQEGERVLGEVHKERDAFRKEMETERQRGALVTARRGSMDDPDLQIRPDEVPAVEKLMQDEVIGTHKAAARLYRAQQQVGAPRVEPGGPMEVPGLGGAGGDEYKGILTDPLWGRKKAHQVLNEFRRGSAR